MQSLQSRLLYHLVKYQLAKLARLNLPLPQYRLAREAAALRLFKMPPDVTVQEAQFGGCRGEWLRPKAPQGKGIVL